MTKENIKSIDLNPYIINQNKKNFIRENINYFSEIFTDFKAFFVETIENYPQEHYYATLHELDQIDAMRLKKIFESVLEVWNLDIKKLYNNDYKYIINLLYNDFEILSKCFEDFNNFFESTINCYKEQHHFAIVYNCEELEAIKYKKVFDSILDNNGFEMEDFLLMPYDF